MEIVSPNEGILTKEEEKQFLEFKRMKRVEEAVGKVAKLECDCLYPLADRATLKQLCRDADMRALGGIVVFPAHVKPCVGYLGSDPKCSLIAAISYPYGGDTTDVKVAAVKRAIKDGIDEAEVYAPVSIIRDGNFAYFKRECKKLRKASKGRAVRVVLDTQLLSATELIKACSAAADAGVNVIRLNGATDADMLVRVKHAVKDKCIIKTEGAENAASFENAISLGSSLVSCKCAVELATLLLSQAQTV